MHMQMLPELRSYNRGLLICADWFAPVSALVGRFGVW